METHFTSVRRLRTVAPRALIIAAALAAASCGASSTAGGGSNPTASASAPQAALISSVDACKLVTQAEASAAVGVQVSNVAGQNGGASQVAGTCYYASADFTASVLVYGMVLPDTQAAKSITAAQMAAAIAGSSTFGLSKPVSGIGDSAIEYTTTGNANNSGMAIFVLKSNVALLIAISPVSNSTAIESLARTAVSRL
ncbi:MAG TPA: hypothetical protein VGG90_10250 [Candidatus Dormibacteraeota bacterium]|jgi:hypothetical protein